MGTWLAHRALAVVYVSSQGYCRTDAMVGAEVLTWLVSYGVVLERGGRRRRGMGLRECLWQLCSLASYLTWAVLGLELSCDTLPILWVCAQELQEENAALREQLEHMQQVGGDWV